MFLKLFSLFEFIHPIEALNICTGFGQDRYAAPAYRHTDLFRTSRHWRMWAQRRSSVPIGALVPEIHRKIRIRPARCRKQQVIRGVRRGLLSTLEGVVASSDVFPDSIISSAMSVRSLQYRGFTIPDRSAWNTLRHIRRQNFEVAFNKSPWPPPLSACLWHSSSPLSSEPPLRIALRALTVPLVPHPALK